MSTVVNRRLDENHRLKQQKLQAEFHRAVARWLVVLHHTQDLSRMSTLCKISDTLQYITELPAHDCYQLVLDSWMKPISPTDLPKERERIFSANLPSVRFQQLMTRLFRIVRRPDKDTFRRTSLFRDLFCDFQPLKKVHQSVVGFCHIGSRAVSRRGAQKLSPRSGQLLFGSAMVTQSLDARAPLAA